MLTSATDRCLIGTPPARWGATALDEARRSRSQLVVDYLEARCSEEASQVSELCCLAGCYCGALAPSSAGNNHLC
jgi:hypothetical protein